MYTDMINTWRGLYFRGWGDIELVSGGTRVLYLFWGTTRIVWVRYLLIIERRLDKRVDLVFSDVC